MNKNLSRIACICITLTWNALCYAQAPANIVRVEEDWELVVDTPDPLQDAPQFSTWMSPNDSLNAQYFGADFNHAQRVGYAGGGFQTKSMFGSSVVDERTSNAGERLKFPGETLRWTQLMAVIRDELVFAVKNGSSSSWGEFGGPDTLVKIPSPVANLDRYNPKISVESSGVGFASNRVASMKLVRVRLYTDKGLVNEVSVDSQVNK